jgi:hypothetical protein
MTRFPNRRFVLLAALALGCVGLAVPASAGNVVRIDSKVTIAESPPAFHGRVISDNEACEQGRTVKLLQKRPGQDDSLGRDTTNNNGKWQVVVEPLSSGAYYAKVRRREEGAAGTTFVCRRDLSRTVVVD